ncbi:LuxR C-terminal-related transcriptional regulator [Streptomyces inhibens]|uniref:LuxR C-terminal-related transcriptional regulator n=1 Tax=Streptomyces inhibens TaxID=2293571 RepID=UPI00378E3057
MCAYRALLPRTVKSAHWRRLHLRCSLALTRAAAYTEPPMHAERLASAARHAQFAGSSRRATALLAQASELRSGATRHGEAELTRGMHALRGGGAPDAREALLLAATMLHGAGRADDEVTALAWAADASWTAGDRTGYLATAQHLGTRAAAPGPVRDYHRGVAAALEGDGPLSVALLRAASRPAAGDDGPDALLHASRAALALGELADARDHSTRALAHVEPHPAALPAVLGHLALVELAADRYPRAASHARRGLPIAIAHGHHNSAAQLRSTLAMTAALRGDTADCRSHVRAALATAQAHGLMVPALMATWSLGLLDLAHNRPREALERLRPLVRGGSGLRHFAWHVRVIPSFVEAVALACPDAPAPGRERDLHQARAALRTLEGWARTSGDRQMKALTLYCQALLADRGAADAYFHRALASAERTGSGFTPARIKLSYGMYLRRHRRPGEARVHLRGSRLLFESCGAEVWAERAREELRAAGQAEPGTRPRPLTGLTAQQLRVARHVAEGRTNREVATLLALSHRTVDHHLRNVFAALGIRSRVELVHALASVGESAALGAGGR